MGDYNHPPRIGTATSWSATPYDAASLAAATTAWANDLVLPMPDSRAVRSLRALHRDLAALLDRFTPEAESTGPELLDVRCALIRLDIVAADVASDLQTARREQAS